MLEISVGGCNPVCDPIELRQSDADKARQAINDNTSAFGHVDVNRLAQQTKDASPGVQLQVAEQLPPRESQQYLQALQHDQGCHGPHDSRDAREARDLIRGNTSCDGHVNVKNLAEETKDAGPGLQRAIEDQLSPRDRQQYMEALHKDKCHDAQKARDEHLARDLIKDNTFCGDLDMERLVQQSRGVGRGVQQAIADQLPPRERQQYLNALRGPVFYA